MTDEEMWTALIAVEQAYDNGELSREEAVLQLCTLGLSPGEANEHLDEGEAEWMPRPAAADAASIGALTEDAEPEESLDEVSNLPPTGTDRY